LTILADVKAALRITHDSDDLLLERLILSATQEYVNFAGVETDSDDTEIEVPEDVINGVVLMVQADYDADPLDREKYRDAAKHLWGTHRLDFGI